MGQPSWSVLTYMRLKGRLRSQSVTCQECGKPFKVVTTLHLRTHGMTRRQYRRRFGVRELRCEEHLFHQALRRLPHTRQEVIAFLKNRLASGKPLTAKAVRAEHRTYYLAVQAYFRYWHDALLAAEIDPLAVAGRLPHKYWSRQRVHEAIQRRASAGESIRLRDVRRDSPGLYGAAYHHAGGWRRALRDLGYDYQELCTEPTKWSADRVVRRILEREALEQSLNAKAVLREDSTLLSAAERYFESWWKALRASGIDPETITQTRQWTAERIVRQIRRLGAVGAPLSHKAAADTDSGLVAAASQMYGSWNDALLASGYDPAVVRCRLPAWTRSSIIQMIRDRADAGLPVRVGSIEPHSAVVATYRLFGSWHAALEAAGVAHLVPKPRRWSKRAVIDAIRARHADGRPLYSAAAERDSKALTTAARRYCGNWSLALKAAGFDPARIRQHLPKWTAEAILDDIRRRAAAGESLASHSCQPASMVNAARRMFGSWPKALAAAGVGKPATRAMSRKSRVKRKAKRRK